MLKFMRDSSQSVLIYVLFGILVFVFAVSFGPGSGSCGPARTDFAAIVDGDVVRREDFVTGYRNQVDYYRRSMGGAFSQEMIERFGIRRQVIDQLIDAKILEQEASRRGLMVTDDDLYDFMKTRYGVDQVSAEDYEAWVQRTFQTSVVRFEDQVRGNIIAERLSTVVRDMVDVGNEELKAKFMREGDRAKIQFVQFEPSAAKPEVSDADIDAVLAKEADAVKARFEKNGFRYRTPKQVKARQILKNVPADASDADVAKIRAELIDFKSQIEGGADFAALAKANSDDVVSREKGGDMGFVRQGMMAKALTDKLFAMKTDEIAGEPVKTRQGLHLLQVTEIKPPTRKEFDEVKREVAKSLLVERAGEVEAMANAKALIAKLKAGEDLEVLTMTREAQRDAKQDPEATVLPVRAETPWIIKGADSIPRLGADKSLIDAVFAAKLEDPVLDEPFKVGRNLFVVVLSEREIPDPKQFDDKKESLREEARQAKREKVFRSWIKDLRERAKVELNPELFPPEDKAANPFGAPAAG